MNSAILARPSAGGARASLIALAFVVMGVAAAATVPQSDAVLRLDEVTTRPKVLEKRNPPYAGSPLEADPKWGVIPEGDLKVEFVIDRTGMVRDVRVVQPFAPGRTFEADTVAAVRAWKFAPATKDGAPVAVRAEMVVTFSMRPGPSRGGPAPPALVASAAVSGVDDDFGKGMPLASGGGVVSPVQIKHVAPRYPDGLLKEKVSGQVRIEAIVKPDGELGEMRVVQSDDSRFDREALAATRQWRFKPATKDGKSIAVVATLVLSFRAH